MYFVCAIWYPHVVLKCDWLKVFYCNLGYFGKFPGSFVKMNWDYPTWEKKADKRVTKVTLALWLHWQSSVKVYFQYVDMWNKKNKYYWVDFEM